MFDEINYEENKMEEKCSVMNAPERNIYKMGCGLMWCPEKC